MLNLDLIRPLPQPNWALLPFLSQPPTIEAYKKNKSLYSQDIIQQGVYRITASVHAVHAWGDDLYIVNKPDWWKWSQDGKGPGCPWSRDDRAKIASSNRIWLDSIEKGTITVNNKVYTFIGVFEKNGSVISLNTLHKEAIDCV